jgi:hypothetical protein
MAALRTVLLILRFFFRPTLWVEKNFMSVFFGLWEDKYAAMINHLVIAGSSVCCLRWFRGGCGGVMRRSEEEEEEEEEEEAADSARAHDLDFGYSTLSALCQRKAPSLSLRQTQREEEQGGGGRGRHHQLEPVGLRQLEPIPCC